jgi:hypothetical protein
MFEKHKFECTFQSQYLTGLSKFQYCKVQALTVKIVWMYLRLIALTLLFYLKCSVAAEERIQMRLSGGTVEGRVVSFGDRKALAFMVQFYVY